MHWFFLSRAEVCLRTGEDGGGNVAAYVENEGLWSQGGLNVVLTAPESSSNMRIDGWY